MDLVTPGIGLIFWTSTVFLLLIVVLKKVAWGPILASVKERDESISKALEAAEKAREEMSEMKADNERILRAAKTERDALLKEAREMKEKIVREAKAQAKVEADKVLKKARENILTETSAARTQLTNEIAHLALEVSEKILRKELSSETKQKEFATGLLKEMKLS